MAATASGIGANGRVTAWFKNTYSMDLAAPRNRARLLVGRRRQGAGHSQEAALEKRKDMLVIS